MRADELRDGALGNTDLVRAWLQYLAAESERETGDSRNIILES
jgi:hypothetical protein